MPTSRETQTEDTIKDIYAKLDGIQAVLGFILEKTKILPENNISHNNSINALQSGESPQ